MMRQTFKARVRNNELNDSFIRSVITMKAFLSGVLLIVVLLGIMIFLSGCPSAFELIFLAPPG